MRDELFDRDFQDGRADLFAGFDRLGRSLAVGLAALHRLQWHAPWKDGRRRKRTGVA